MLRSSVTRKPCDDALLRLLETQMNVVQCDDVGALLGQLATLCDEPETDAATRSLWPEAVSAALGDPRASQGKDAPGAGARAPAGRTRR